jgi:anaerobic selenocysteine-containing dehydrogenase
MEMQKRNNAQSNDENWQSTACMLCSIGCSIEVKTENGHLTKIRGDKASASSEGYICQKAARLDHYQNHSERLYKPLKKTPDGQFVEVEWDQVIPEIAAKMKAIKAQHGGHAFAYYGGGGQGNHLGGTYGSALRAALGTPYLYSALAQEKTGDFWINGKLFGRQSCFVTEGMEEADYAIVLGANPWSAHGVPRTRDLLKSYQKQADKTLVVIDPRRTETAKMADIHLAVKPGQDAFLLSAIIAIILQEGMEDKAFIKEHVKEFESVKSQFIDIPVSQYVEMAGVEESLVRKVAIGFAKASKATVRADLGIQHSLHSTLNSYLEKLLFLVTGNFNKEGGNHLVAQFAPLLGHSKEPEEGGVVTQVTGMKGITKLFPPNILPLEIDNDHPDRIRALIVDSGNPALSGADCAAYRQAFEKLELSVVIDVAMTETARLADYVLPAPTQFEKMESAFFTFGFPTAYFHLRRSVLPPKGDTLPEPEIYRRLVVALGAIPDRFPKLEQVAKLDRRFPSLRLFPSALAATLKLHPEWMAYLPVILYATLGKALPQGSESAATLWGICHFYEAKYAKPLNRAGFKGKGYSQAEALFKEIMSSDKPVAIGTFDYQDTWKMMKTPDKKVHIYIPEMAKALDELAEEIKHSEIQDAEYPFVLMAGERRAYNANQIFRTPDWRKTDKEGGMRIHPEDLNRLGLKDGGMALVRSDRGKIEVSLMEDDTMQPGVLSLPHGYGMQYTDQASGQLVQNGPAINELTSVDYCDPLAKTPYHKHVRVAIESA